MQRGASASVPGANTMPAPAARPACARSSSATSGRIGLKSSRRSGGPAAWVAAAMDSAAAPMPVTRASTCPIRWVIPVSRLVARAASSGSASTG